MKTIRIAFYKKSPSLFGKAIRFKQHRIDGLDWVHSQYSHVELVLTSGASFSSSERDGGTRLKKIDFDHEHWDFIELQIEDKDYRKIKALILDLNGLPYDWTGVILSQLLLLDIDKNSAWFCSEIVAHLLKEIGMLRSQEIPSNISPALLNKKLKIITA